MTTEDKNDESKLNVLITCSGLGSRLGELTDYTNKSLVRVGDKAVISHIIESYPYDTNFVVTIGHYGDHVRQYLNICHNRRNIRFVEIDKFEGVGSSLAYSMLCAEQFLQCPFIFHACDSITEIHNFQDKNCVWVSDKVDNINDYRTILSNGTDLRVIKDKGMTTAGDVYIGKCFISDYVEFWKSLRSVYEERGKFDNTLSDCHAINKMLSEGHKFLVKKTNDWADIGNTQSLMKTRSKFDVNVNVLDKPAESIFFVDDLVVKFFHDSRIVNSRVKRVSFLKNSVPEIVSHSENFYSYKKKPGEILSRYSKFSDDTMRRLLDWSKINLWTVKSEVNFKEKCENFYIEKTKARAFSYLKDRRLDDKEYSINGIKIPSVEHLLNDAKRILLSDIRPTLFHGDFILENILLDGNKFHLLDWRQDFDGSLEYGDSYYDLSKLNHNLIVNHDIINQGLFNIDVDESGDVYVDILCSKKLLDSQKILNQFLLDNLYDTKKVELLTAIIWINMSPLHDKKFGDFLFNFGKLNMFRCINR